MFECRDDRYNIRYLFATHYEESWRMGHRKGTTSTGRSLTWGTRLVYTQLCKGLWSGDTIGLWRR